MILITGATGNIGRELVRELLERDAEFRVLVRDPARAPAGVDHVVGDLADPGSLDFAGVDKLFLLTQGTGVDQAGNALKAAVDVRHVVHLSSAHVALDPVPAMGRWHQERERLVRATGIPATFLRPGGFMTNALDWLPTIHSGNHVFDPAGPGRVAVIDPADIAAVAALVLTEDGHEGNAYTLTGGEALTVAEQVRVLAEVTGLEIEVRPAATPEEVVRFRFPNGAPPELARAVIETVELVRADTVGFRTDTTARLLGRPPRTFRDWCVRNRDVFSRP
jgi:uncharacterized protein YbjT (DUF2867 family)